MFGIYNIKQLRSSAFVLRNYSPIQEWRLKKHISSLRPLAPRNNQPFPLFFSVESAHKVTGDSSSSSSGADGQERRALLSSPLLLFSLPTPHMLLCALHGTFRDGVAQMKSISQFCKFLSKQSHLPITLENILRMFFLHPVLHETRLLLLLLLFLSSPLLCYIRFCLGRFSLPSLSPPPPPPKLLPFKKCRHRRRPPPPSLSHVSLLLGSPFLRSNLDAVPQSKPVTPK